MMNKSKVKTILVVCLVVVSGVLWLFWGNTEQKVVNSENAFVIDQDDPSSTEVPAGETEKKIYVHIVGAVKKPGVYTFGKEPRVIEVIRAAGGFTKQAVRSSVNQAELVGDGVQLVIESKKDSKAKKVEKGDQESSGKINLNAASKEELMTLPGIGESKAMAILSYRDTNGRFQKIEDVMNITGIKNGVFDKIKDYIQV